MRKSIDKLSSNQNVVSSEVRSNSTCVESINRKTLGKRVDNVAYECNICLDVAKEPVVTLCGHLYCWPCLYLWLSSHENSQFCPVCKAPIDPDLVIPIFGRGADASSSPPNVSSSNLSSFESFFVPTVTPHALLDLDSRREAPPPPETAGALRTIRVGCEALDGLEVDQEVERDRLGVQGENSRGKDGEKDDERDDERDREKEKSAEYDGTQTTSSPIAPLATASPEIQDTLLTPTSISLSAPLSPPTPSSSGPLPPEAESSQAPKPIPIRPIGARELLTSSSFQQWKVRSSPLPLPLSSLPPPPSARVARSPSYHGSFFAASPRRPASSDHLPHLAHEAGLIMFPAATHRRSVSSSFFPNSPMTNAADAADSASETAIRRIPSSPSPLPAVAGEGSGGEEEEGRSGGRRNDLMDTTLTTPSMTSSSAEATTPQMTRAFQREGGATAATGGICNDGEVMGREVPTTETHKALISRLIFTFGSLLVMCFFVL